MTETPPNYIPTYREPGWVSVPDIVFYIMSAAKDADVSGKAVLMDLLITLDANVKVQPPSKDKFISEEMLLFLKGVGELDGYNFGDRGDEHGGAFWWRKHLP